MNVILKFFECYGYIIEDAIKFINNHCNIISSIITLIARGRVGIIFQLQLYNYYLFEDSYDKIPNKRNL